MAWELENCCNEFDHKSGFCWITVSRACPNQQVSLFLHSLSFKWFLSLSSMLSRFFGQSKWCFLSLLLVHFLSLHLFQRDFQRAAMQWCLFFFCLPNSTCVCLSTLCSCAFCTGLWAFVVDLRILFFNVDSAFVMWSLLSHNISCSTILAFYSSLEKKKRFCVQKRDHQILSMELHLNISVKLLLATKSLGILHLTKRDHKLFAE